MGLGSAIVTRRAAAEASGAQGHPGTFPSEREVRVAGICRRAVSLIKSKKGFSRC